MRPRRLPALPAAAAAVLALSACGAGNPAGDAVLQGVGRIPGASPAGASAAVDIGSLRAPAREGATLGEKAVGNRVIIIGDSILAGTAARYGNEMCRELSVLGWRSVVEAESGQPAYFGREVLRERIYEGWDAAVVFLGSNQSPNIERYRTDMTRIVESLAPRPALLLTTTLFRDSQKAVNDVIREIAGTYDNVSLLDWGTASLQEGVLNADRVHPTSTGRTFLVKSVASALGPAPSGTGGCISAKFEDDSMGREVMPSTTVAGPGPAVATTIPVAATTLPAAGTTLPPSTTVAPATTAPAGAATTTSKP
ncbi:MAG: SGNH/GDSL hydrolase family protein [Acidimicrobiales bacterium]